MNEYRTYTKVGMYHHTAECINYSSEGRIELWKEDRVVATFPPDSVVEESAFDIEEDNS